MNNPYMAPAADMAVDSGSDTLDGEHYQPRIFAWNGRIGRLRYLGYSTLFTLIGGSIVGAVLALTSVVAGNGLPNWKYVSVLLLPILSVVPAKRRLNDLDHSGWFAVLMLIPFVKNLLGLYLIFGRGTDRRNQYGAMPCDNPRGMFWVAMILPLIFLVGILAAIALPAYSDYMHKARSAKAAQAQMAQRYSAAPAGEADAGKP